MKKQPKNLEFALQVTERRELVESTIPWWRDFSVQNARQVVKHLRGIGEPCSPFRIGFVHSYTSDLLDPWLELHAAVNGIEPQLFHAPYGFNVLQSDPQSELAQCDPQLTVFMLRREDLHPQLSQPSLPLDNATRELIAAEAVTNLVSVLARFRQTLSGELLVSILPARLSPALGDYDVQAEASEQIWWQALLQSIAARFRDEFESVSLLNDDQLLRQIGQEQFFDLRFWYSSQFPFSQYAASEFSKRVINRAVLKTAPKAKVLVLDADNTLWGGVVGEDGPEGIALGPDYPGSCFMDFQRRLLAMQQRGFLLTLCSKNNEADAQEILDDHPHQVLRSEHFAASRVNWLTKPENIRSMATELNLGLDSFVFVDDSDYECALVRRELPEVTVIQTPSRATDIPACLEQLARLQISSLTREDLEKSRMYAQERIRRERKAEIQASGGGLDDYLASLGMTMVVSFDAQTQAKRLAQLSQKTNQFNLTTRRYDEQQVRSMMADPQWVVSSFSLQDNFGDSGVVGLLLAQRDTHNSAKATIDTLLMSCRVIGRRAESAFLYAALRYLRALGINEVEGLFIPSRKNQLVADFYPNHGFEKVSDGYRLTLAADTDEQINQIPIDVTVAAG